MGAALLLLVVACSSKPDRAAGKYQDPSGRGRVFELRADGSLDIDPVTDDRCRDETAALADCRAKQRWSREGTKVTLARGALARPMTGGLAGMFSSTDDRCRCALEHYEATLDGDTLTIGKERAVRVR
jgi:hypothetical protein